MLDHRIDECLTLQKLPNSSSKWLCPVTLPSAVNEDYISSLPLKTFGVVSLMILATMMGVTQLLFETMLIVLHDHPSIISFIIFHSISFPLCCFVPVPTDSVFFNSVFFSSVFLSLFLTIPLISYHAFCLLAQVFLPSLSSPQHRVATILPSSEPAIPPSFPGFPSFLLRVIPRCSECVSKSSHNHL